MAGIRKHWHRQIPKATAPHFAVLSRLSEPRPRHVHAEDPQERLWHGLSSGKCSHGARVVVLRGVFSGQRILGGGSFQFLVQFQLIDQPRAAL